MMSQKIFAALLAALVCGQSVAAAVQGAAQRAPALEALLERVPGLQDFNPGEILPRKIILNPPWSERVPAELDGLTGRVVTPDSPDWDAARRGFNALFDHHPKAIVFCRTAQDVVNAVNWVRETKTPFRIRAGGHSYEGYSSVDGGLVIDVSELKSFSFDERTKTVTIGAGMRALEFQEKLWERGVAVPAATAPSVGMAGLTLGGGFGILTRKFGTTADNLVSVEMVAADGRVIPASETENPELFRALRGGGGGNFGVLISMTYRTHPISKVAFTAMTWDWDQFEKVVPAYLQWAASAPNEITPFLRLAADRKITLFAQYTPDQDSDAPKMEELLAPMIQAGRPNNPLPRYSVVVPFIDVVRILAAVAEGVNTPTGQQTFKSASAYVMKPLPQEAILIMKKQIEAAPATHGVQPSMLQLLGGGGAAGEVAPSATAMFFRKALFVAQYDVYMSQGEEQTAIKWVEGFREAMRPYTEGAYVNYHDSLLANPLREYYGDNLEWLVEVKRTYDPGNLFNYPQSIPVSLPPGQ